LFESGSKVLLGYGRCVMANVQNRKLSMNTPATSVVISSNVKLRKDRGWGCSM